MVEPSRRNRWRIVIVTTLAGFAGQAMALLFYSDLYPTWLLVSGPVVWGLVCAAVMLRLARAERIGDR